MIKVVDIVYHCHHEYTTPGDVLEKHRPTLAFTAFIKDKVDYTVIRHLAYEGKETANGIRYAYFKRKNAPWHIPFNTHRYIKSLQPDIVLVHGFVFPLQVIALKMLLGKKTNIILQHHAEYPVNSVRKVFQQIADKYIDRYMFTADAIARPWLHHHIIRNKNKIIALAGASVALEKMDKLNCKQKLQFSGSSNFLWVGRLNENKDPITVIKGFEKYILVNPAARLFMIYQTEELLEPVKKLIAENQQLLTRIRLIGKIASHEIAQWYNAADFFITGSHAEAAGYALLEAMSVGCIPVATRIPSFQKILNNGEVGYLFAAGDEHALLQSLTELAQFDVCSEALKTELYFQKNLSAKVVADGMYRLFCQLSPVQL